MLERGSASYVVPAGYRAVVRQISAYNNDSQGHTWGVSLAPYSWIAGGTLAAGAFSHQTGWWVANAGETIDASTNATTVGVYVYVGGYLLTAS